MIKRLNKVGNSYALILDRALMELIGLKENGEVLLTVRDGSILISPTHPNPVDEERFKACLDRVIDERREVLRRLAE